MFWHMYTELLGLYGLKHNGHVTCICNVVAIFVQCYISNMCTVTLDLKHNDNWSMGPELIWQNITTSFMSI